MNEVKNNPKVEGTEIKELKRQGHNK